MEEIQKPMGLYVHIPFCSKKCDYCDFVSFSMDKKAQQLYLEGLFAEIDRVKSDFYDKTFNSIFIGGGTPSILYEGFIASLSRKIFSSFHFEDKTEFTIEINPSSFTREKFFEYVESGVNRISVGLQCLNSKLLRNNGRLQTIESVKKTFKILKESQFSNVNGDIMIGLPGQSPKDVVKTAKFLIKHNVKHISTYTLQVEKHTELYKRIKNKEVSPLKDKVIVNIYDKLNKLLTANGFRRYELSNYSKPCFESEHNQKYWDETNYLGLGVSAHSYIDGYRYSNTARLDTYLENVNAGKSAVHKKEYINLETRRTERIMLSLRTTKGLDLKRFEQDFNEDLLKSKSIKIRNLKRMQMIEIKDGFLRITDNYFNVSNSIILELL